MRNTLVTVGRLNQDGGQWLAKYAEGVIPLIAQYQGSIVTRVLPKEPVVGDAEHMPDLIAIIQFPNEEAIREFLGSPEYQQFVPHRERAFAWLRSYVADDAGR
ncbi:MAG: DUF1330 domain-containing protein [Phycisphaerales bacterium]|nr:DUF1330 domain-containing protein [Phycisphaerales bacterium]